MDAATVGEGKGVVGEVFTALGVVLILVGPVEDDLLAGVGNGVGIALVSTLADEIAPIVVAGKESEEVAENGVAVFGGSVGESGDAGAEIFDLG